MASLMTFFHCSLKTARRLYPLLSMEPSGLPPKKFQTSVAVPPAPVRVPSQRPLAPSVASVTSVANDKDDNEMILRAVYRSPGICLTAEENPRKHQLGDRLMKGGATSYRVKWGPPNEVGRIAQHARKGEGRK